MWTGGVFVWHWGWEYDWDAIEGIVKGVLDKKDGDFAIDIRH